MRWGTYLQSRAGLAPDIQEYRQIFILPLYTIWKDAFTSTYFALNYFRVKVNGVVLHINKKQPGIPPLILQATTMLENLKHDAALKTTARYITQNEIIVSNGTNAHWLSFFPGNCAANSLGPQMQN